MDCWNKYWSNGLGHTDEGPRDECILFNHKDYWNMEHNPQQWFMVYATVVWVENTHFPPLWTVGIREKSASVRWVAERGERMGPWGGGIVLWGVGADSAPKVDAHMWWRLTLTGAFALIFFMVDGSSR